MKKSVLFLFYTVFFAQCYGKITHKTSLEIAVGSAVMNRHPYSPTENTPSNNAQSENQEWKNFGITLGPPAYSTLTNTPNSNACAVEMDMPGGYRANWNKTTPNPRSAGFTGQINIDHMMKKKNLGVSLYAGLGYNGARSSSTVKDSTFDTTVYQNVSYLQNVAHGNDQIQQTSVTLPVGNYKVGELNDAPLNSDGATTNRDTQCYTTNSLPQFSESLNNIPAPKMTISSGLMFSAGTRLGAMIGHFFPHFRVGWAAYQLRAKMTHQMPTITKAAKVMGYNAEENMAGIRSSGMLYNNEDGRDTLPSGRSMNSLYVGVEQTIGQRTLVEVTSEGGKPLELEGIYQNTTELSPFYEHQDLINVSSQPKWGNAVTLGGGLDWSPNQKMTLGVYYQIALLKKTHFNKWNKSISAGITESSVDFAGNAWTATATKLTDTGRQLTATYGPAAPTIFIKPLLQTFMFSAKYTIR